MGLKPRLKQNPSNTDDKRHKEVQENWNYSTQNLVVVQHTLYTFEHSSVLDSCLLYVHNCACIWLVSLCSWMQWSIEGLEMFVSNRNQHSERSINLLLIMSPLGRWRWYLFILHLRTSVRLSIQTSTDCCVQSSKSAIYYVWPNALCSISGVRNEYYFEYCNKEALQWCKCYCNWCLVDLSYISAMYHAFTLFYINAEWTERQDWGLEWKTCR